MNWRPMVLVGGQWTGNALVFATREEAEDNARDLMDRWLLVEGTRAEEIDAPVNYRWVDRKLVRVT